MKLKTVFAAAAAVACLGTSVSALSNFDNLVAHCGVGLGLALLDADPSGTASADAANQFIIEVADDRIAALQYSSIILDEGLRRLRTGPGNFQQFVNTLRDSCRTLVN